MSTITLDAARQVLQAQPFSRLIGTDISRIDEGSIEFVLPIRDELLQQYGFVHGGVLSYLADNALTFAGAHGLGGAVVTSEYKINYLRPALQGTLIARAALVHAGKTQAISRCEIWVADGGEKKMVAAAQGTVTLAGQAPRPR